MNGSAYANVVRNLGASPKTYTIGGVSARLYGIAHAGGNFTVITDKSGTFSALAAAKPLGPARFQAVLGRPGDRTDSSLRPRAARVPRAGVGVGLVCGGPAAQRRRPPSPPGSGPGERSPLPHTPLRRGLCESCRRTGVVL